MSKSVLISQGCGLHALFIDQINAKISTQIRFGVPLLLSEEQQTQINYHLASCARCHTKEAENLQQAGFDAEYIASREFCGELHMLVNYLVEKGKMPREILDEYGGIQPSGFTAQEIADYEAHLKECKICQKYMAIIQNGWKTPDEYKDQGKSYESEKLAGLAATR